MKVAYEAKAGSTLIELVHAEVVPRPIGVNLGSA